MNRGIRGNKRRYDDHNNTHYGRPSWEEAFERQVRQVRQQAIAEHGNEHGIPVLSFTFVGERQLRDAHQTLGFGRSGDLRDRIAPILRPSDAGPENPAKRQKKAKETAVPTEKQAARTTSDDKGTKKGGDRAKNETNPKEDKAARMKRFDDELDNYFKDNKGVEDSKETKKEEKASGTGISKEKTADKDGVIEDRDIVHNSN